MNKKSWITMALAVAAVMFTIVWLWGQLYPGDTGPVTKPAVKKATSEHSDAVLAGVPVLMYHSIGDELDNDAVISKDRFMEHMAYLHQKSYQPVSLDELADYLEGKSSLPLKPVVITFDDGYRDTYEVALPVLRRYGFKSAMFIPAADAGDRLSWEELRAMRSAGVEIGSHSFNHQDMGGMSPDEQAKEIVKSKALLDKNLGQDTRYFCYPNGSYDNDTLRLLKENGFRLAVTIEPGWVERGSNPLTLRRVWLGNSVDVGQLHERLTRKDYPIL